MSAIASQITSLTIVYSTVYSDADQRKHQSSASLAFVQGTHRGPVNSPHKWPVIQTMFSLDDVIMWNEINQHAQALMTSIYFGRIKPYAQSNVIFLYCINLYLFVLKRVFVASSRHLRRLVSSTASPIFAHFSESIAGATTIRAYGMQETFCHHSAKLADHNMNVHIIKTSSEG